VSALETARIAALLEPFLEQPLQESQLNQISIYIDLLLRWNARINLTAIRNEEEIVTRHFGESFFMARHLFPLQALEGAPSKLRLGGSGRVGSSVLDIGSGAGFPALPLKIWSPNLHLTLIESNHKKSAFLREVARALTPTSTDIDVITDRIETVIAGPVMPQAEVVTLRAVEHFETILPQAVEFLAPAGRLALLIGAAQLPLLTTLTKLEWQLPITVPESHSRVLSIGIHP
jgi:16S rRNA (guanine527-N7)-methyltransferase